jgi:DNA-directed RNA polymerase specialized sigma24 family protein
VKIRSKNRTRLGAHVPSARLDASAGAIGGSAVDRLADTRKSALEILLGGGASEDGVAASGASHDLDALLDWLPPRDADILWLYLTPAENPRSQYELAEIFGVTQGGISWAIQGAITRLRWHVRWAHLTPERMRTGLTDAGLDTLSIEVLQSYWTTGSQSETAARLNLTQGVVRYRIVMGLARLQRTVGCEEVHRGLSELFAGGPRLTPMRGGKPGRRAGVPPSGKVRHQTFCRRITARGKTQTISEWSSASGVPARAIYHRVYMGWPPERAIFEPIRRCSSYGLVSRICG